MGANPLVGSVCPDPECQSPCAVVNTSTPFVRLPAYASNPLAPGSHCFDIAKRDQNFYVQLKNETAGFHRNVSTDGGFTWTTDGPLVFPKDQGWWTLLKCPDLQYLENGDLLLYFTGGMGGDEYAIGRALSTD